MKGRARRGVIENEMAAVWDEGKLMMQRGSGRRRM